MKFQQERVSTKAKIKRSFSHEITFDMQVKVYRHYLNNKGLVDFTTSITTPHFDLGNHSSLQSIMSETDLLLGSKVLTLEESSKMLRNFLAVGDPKIHQAHKYLSEIRDLHIDQPNLRTSIHVTFHMN